MQLMSEVVGGHQGGSESSLLGLKVYACVHKPFHSCPTLCNLMSCRLPGSSVHGILQARILEWVAMPSSRDQPTFLTSPALAGGFSTTSEQQKPALHLREPTLQRTEFSQQPAYEYK